MSWSKLGDEVSKYVAPFHEFPPSSVGLPIPVAENVTRPSSTIIIPEFGHSPCQFPSLLSQALYVADESITLFPLISPEPPNPVTSNLGFPSFAGKTLSVVVYSIVPIFFSNSFLFL